MSIEKFKGMTNAQRDAIVDKVRQCCTAEQMAEYIGAISDARKVAETVKRYADLAQQCIDLEARAVVEAARKPPIMWVEIKEPKNMRAVIGHVSRMGHAKQEYLVSYCHKNGVRITTAVYRIMRAEESKDNQAHEKYEFITEMERLFGRDPHSDGVEYEPGGRGDFAKEYVAKAMESYRETGEVNLNEIMTNEQESSAFVRNAIKNRTKDALLREGAVAAGNGIYVDFDKTYWTNQEVALRKRALSVKADLLRLSELYSKATKTIGKRELNALWNESSILAGDEYISVLGLAARIARKGVKE